MKSILEIRGLRAGYDKNDYVLKDLDLDLRESEVLAVIGRNGAGKSTLAKAVAGMIRFIEGHIFFKGHEIIGLETHEIARRGVGFYLQGGRIFPTLSVEENLRFAMNGPDRKVLEEKRRYIEDYLGPMGKRSPSGRSQKASFMSGGEQRRLAMAMILCLNPGLLVLDEPSAGLSPVNVNNVYEALREIRTKANLPILLIEQNVNMAAKFADRMVLIENGRIARESTTAQLKTATDIHDFFFGNS